MLNFNCLILITTLAILQGCSTSTKSTQPINGQDLVTVESCHDGDTCKVITSQGFTFSVRLAGIDAPEMGRYKKSGQPYAFEAREALLKLIASNKVEMKQVDLGAYNRPVVVFFVDGTNLNLALVEQGLAESYKGKTRYDIAPYLAAEESAKSKNLNIWTQGKNYISPRDFRKKDKQKDTKEAE